MANTTKREFLQRTRLDINTDALDSWKVGLMLISVLRSAYEKSFDVPWPSNPRRRRCPICEQWTMFKRNFPKDLERWECCHMDGAERCGYSELMGGD